MSAAGGREYDATGGAGGPNDAAARASVEGSRGARKEVVSEVYEDSTGGGGGGGGGGEAGAKSLSSGAVMRSAAPPGVLQVCTGPDGFPVVAATEIFGQRFLEFICDKPFSPFIRLLWKNLSSIDSSK